VDIERETTTHEEKKIYRLKAAEEKSNLPRTLVRRHEVPHRRRGQVDSKKGKETQECRDGREKTENVRGLGLREESKEAEKDKGMSKKALKPSSIYRRLITIEERADWEGKRRKGVIEKRELWSGRTQRLWGNRKRGTSRSCSQRKEKKLGETVLEGGTDRTVDRGGGKRNNTGIYLKGKRIGRAGEEGRGRKSNQRGEGRCLVKGKGQKIPVWANRLRPENVDLGKATHGISWGGRKKEGDARKRPANRKKMLTRQGGKKVA